MDRDSGRVQTTPVYTEDPNAMQWGADENGQKPKTLS